jgi:hypothetical protein
MNEFENDVSKEDPGVEITDLDPIEKISRFSRMFVALEKRPSLRKRFWCITLTSCTVVLILLVLFSTFSYVRSLAFSYVLRLVPSQSNTLVTTTASSVDPYPFDPKDEVVWTLGDSSPFIPSATLGPAPDDCPTLSQTHPFESKDAQRAAGSSPVLVIGLQGPHAVLTHFTRAQPPEIGWYKRIVMLTQTNYAGTVTFRGGELHDGTPIWFGMKQHSHEPITTFTVLPLNSSVSNHTASNEEWGLSTASLYIPRAGCYFLMATWPAGGWIVFFAAGR